MADEASTPAEPGTSSTGTTATGTPPATTTSTASDPLQRGIARAQRALQIRDAPLANPETTGGADPDLDQVLLAERQDEAGDRKRTASQVLGLAISDFTAAQAALQGGG